MLRLDKSVINLMQQVEKVLIRVIVLGLLALVVVQLVTVRAKDPMAFYLTFAQKIESVPLEQEEGTWEPNLILSVESGDASHLRILLNDVEAGDLKEGKLSLKVKKGDRLSADARHVAKGVRLKVSGVGQDFTYPALNQLWVLQGSVLDLGTVNTR
ncbi:MAG TPA: hypothetical protein VNU93_09545 [Verrucomicrobiae bacterium]|nr:hypothetical protein [Verrucomicrobiae bacterium]